jgi:TRAP-type C4-dicarboxylate transport system substrate-binding protein
VASLYMTTRKPASHDAIVDAAAKVRDLNLEYVSEGNDATVTARFGKDGITICDPNRANEGADKVFQRIYDRAI